MGGGRVGETYLGIKGVPSEAEYYLVAFRMDHAFDMDKEVLFSENSLSLTRQTARLETEETNSLIAIE